MPNKNIYLPDDIDARLRLSNINLSRFVREKLIEVLGEDNKCPMCGQKWPKK